MTGRLILTGDVNLMNVADATVPFRHVAATLHDADVVFGNLECCLHLPPQRSRVFIVEPIKKRCPPEHNLGVLHRSSSLAVVLLAVPADWHATNCCWPCPISVDHSRG